MEEDSYEHIEKADKVIRFNDFNRRRNFNPKSTQRCDVLFTHYDSWPITKPGFSSDIKNVVIAIPYPFHCERIIKRVEERKNNEYRNPHHVQTHPPTGRPKGNGLCICRAYSAGADAILRM